MSPGSGFIAAAAMRIVTRTLPKAVKMLRSKIATATRTVNAQAQPAYVRSGGPRQPIHPVAWLRQQKRVGKWYSTTSYPHVNAVVRRFLSTGRPTASGPRIDRSKLPVSNTSRAVSRFPGRAPFACTLRPNLTGGALPRSAGGYSVGGSVRYFSHTPAAQAQVVQNVSQAMRAFWLKGHRARYDGVGPQGEKRYRTVSAAQEEARVRMSAMPRNAPGSFIDFQVSPTITALSPLGVAFPFATAEVFGLGVKPEAGLATLHADGFLDVLSVDFARALRDLTAVMNDLKSLSRLGDLPITLEKGNTLRVRFPGVDADMVERLCDDVGVRRGVVGQDPDFDLSAGVPVALRFPYAPDEAGVKTITSPGGSVRSNNSSDSEVDEMFMDEYESNPWLSEPEHEGYESMSPSALSTSDDYEGLEGIYRFIEECDRARVVR
ncbi:hypothetical protein QBC39DRAFT_354189 [Podospora conica]|nr:hypothetical protein QBC39DRAFT_354189 [Schizothecium conicum]